MFHGTKGHRPAAVIAGAALVALASLIPQVASATTQTKFYSATGSGGNAYVGVANTVTVALGNEASSTQTFGSAELTFNSLPASAVQVVKTSLPAGWSGQVVSNSSPAVVLLTSQKTAVIAPAAAPLSVQVTVTPTAAGTITIVPQVKQSNNFSGTGNDFILDSSSGLSISVLALSVQFAQQPSSTLPQSLPGVAPPYFASFCNPVSVQLYNGALPFAASGVPVTITHVSTANPGLYYGTSAVTSSGASVNTDATGLATFGTCASGLAATVVGTGYALSAGSPAAASAATSTSFAVTPTCFVSCTQNPTSLTTGTTANVTGSNTGAFQLFASFGQGVALSCDSAVTKPGTPVDPLVAVAQAAAGAVSGTLTLTFPKSVVNSLSNNGTPLMPVCAGASAAFPAKGDPSTGLPWPGSTAYPFQGLLFDCTDSTYLGLVASNAFPVQICVQSRAKIGGGAERIVVFASDLSDPSFW
jgi:hypothetical protein